MTHTFSLLARLTLVAGLAIALPGCLSGADTGTTPPDSNEQAPPPHAGQPGPKPNPPGKPAPPADPEEPAEPEPEPEPEPKPEPEPEPGPAPPLPIPSAPGGLVENSMTATARGLLTAAQINAFVPERGAFNFPAPYNTRGARITNASDCGGQDCVIPVGYSYWRNTNNHVNDDEMLIFLGMNDRRGGNGPTLFRYNKVTEEVSNAGPLFPAGSRFAASSGEMWYFSPSLPTILYIRDGARLVRYDVLDKTFETVFDAADHFGSGHYIWQMHTSNDDRVHSATLRRSSDYAELGCFVYFEHTKEFRYFPKKGNYDECQIDRSGRYLVIKENVTGQHGADNRFIDLQNKTERLLTDPDGAGGHSDMGYGVMIAADNWSVPNAWRIWDFTHATLDGTTTYRNNDWMAPAPNHASFSHARPDVPLSEQYICGSAASSRIGVHSNEVICFLLKSGSHEKTLVVAPVMTDMAATGGGDTYNKMPKGNLDVTGRYFIWTTNMGGNRIDAFIVKIPAQKLYD